MARYNQREASSCGSANKAPLSPMYDRYYESKKKAARKIYTARPLIYSPFFHETVLLSSEGFRHLSVSSQGQRSRDEQIRRFILLPLALYILETATTLRGYRKQLVSVGSSKERKMIQWWRFAESFREEGIKAGVVVRKVGNEKLHFWSTMLYSNDYGPILPKGATGKLIEVGPSEMSRTLLPPVANAPTKRG
jgi:hypothetical protein